MEVSKDIQCERETLVQIITGNDADALTALTENDFAGAEHKYIFKLLNQMLVNGKELSPVSFAMENKDALMRMDVNFSVAEFLRVMVFGDVGARIQRLQEKTNVRKVIALRDNINSLLTKNKKSDAIFSEIENELIKYQSTGFTRTEITPEQLAETCIETISNRRDKEKLNKKVIFTGYKELNYITGGFERGDLVIISAKSGDGKSALAMNLSYQIAMIQKRPVYYINSEMTTEQMALRWAAITSKFNYRKMKVGNITDDEMITICENVDKVYKSKLYTLTIPDLQIANILTELRKAKRKYNIDVAVVDYIGRMDMTDNKDKEDWKLLKAAAMKLKTMAQQLDLVVIMIAQLNKSGNLAQASQMDQEADLWLNLTRVRDEEQLGKMYPFNAIAYVNKARNAENEVALPLLFTGDTLTFISNKEEAEQWQSKHNKAKAEYGEQTSVSSNSSDSEPTSFESFAKAPTKNYRRKTYRN